MGYIRHHAIIITGSYDQWIIGAYRKAIAIFGASRISDIVESGLNHVETFMVAPDGSKEGWEDSDLGDQRRQDFIHWLNAQRYDDGSSPLAWAEFFYGDDNGEAGVVSHSGEGMM